MTVEIKRHGLPWYFDGQLPKCPECERDGTSIEATWGIGIPEPTSTVIYLRCLRCGCHWIQTRDEEGEQDASTDLC